MAPVLLKHQIHNVCAAMKKKHWLDTYAVVEDLFQRRCWGTFLFASILILGRSALIGTGIAGAGYFVSNSSNLNQISSQSSQNDSSSQVFIANDAKLPVLAGGGNSEGIVAGSATENNEFKESDWDLNNSLAKQKETGFYCIRERKGFDGGEIWYREKLKIGEVIKIRFSLKSDESIKDARQSPKLILLYGRKEDNGPYYRMFIPDVDINFIGFENTSSEKRISPSYLLRPLNFSDAKQIDLEYSVGSAHSNDAFFQYKLSYVPSSDDGKQVTDDGSFQSSFPWPNAKDTEQEFGIGAFKGTCFRVISFGKESQ